MARVVVVSGDERLSTVVQRGLECDGHLVEVALGGRDGAKLITRTQPEVCIIDLVLTDASSTALIELLRERSPRTSIVAVTPPAGGRAAVIAIRAGAADCLEQPVDLAALLSTVRAMTGRGTDEPPPQASSEAHAARRWAAAVLPVALSPNDVRTLAAWGRLAAAAPGTLKNWCATVPVSAKRSLDFARMLRVVLRMRHGKTPADTSLDVADSRTLGRLLRLGRTAHGHRVPVPLRPSVQWYLETQGWVDDTAALHAIRELLGARNLGD